MLGGDAVGLGDHLVLVGAQDDLAVVAPRDPGDIGGRQHRQLPLDLGDRGMRQLLRGGQQDRRRGRAVLGLAQAGRSRTSRRRRSRRR